MESLTRPFFTLAASIRIMAALCVVSASLGVSRAQPSGVAVELQCWQGEDDSAIVETLSFDSVGKPFGCRILIANNTDVSLDGAVFTLTFGEHTPVPLISNPALGGYDPGAYYNCTTYGGGPSPAGLAPPPPGTAFFRPNMVMDILSAFPGFPTGVKTGGIGYPYNRDDLLPRCTDYHLTPSVAWTPQIPGGETEVLRVEFRSGYLRQGATFQTALRLDVTNLPAGLSVSPLIAPIDVAMPTVPLSTYGPSLAIAPRLAPTLALAGSASIGTNATVATGAQSGFRVDLFLPYLRQAGAGVWVVAADGNFDALAGDVLLFDPADLQLNVGYADYHGSDFTRFRDALEVIDQMTPGTALPLPLVKLDESHYRLDFGHLAGNVGPGNYGIRYIALAWAANFNQSAAVQGFLSTSSSLLTGKVCGATDQNPTATCRDAQSNLVAEQALLGQISGAFRLDANVGMSEGSAATPFQNVYSQLVTPFLPWRDAELVTTQQVPNDSPDALGSERRGVPVQTRVDISARPHVLSHSNVLADTGWQSNLPAREVPRTLAGAWSPVGADLALPPDTTEVRLDCDVSRYGVESFGYDNECSHRVFWKVPRNARSSINGSLYSRTDMTLASLGATAHYSVIRGGTSLVSGKASVSIEVNSRSVFELSAIRSTTPNDLARQVWWGEDRTTGQFAGGGCVFSNTGIDNVQGPVEIEVTWPIGFAPLDAAEIYARFLYGDATLDVHNAYQDSGTPIAEADFEVIDYDLDARRMLVRIQGPPPAGYFPGPDQVADPIDYADARWVGVRIDGMYVPGVDRFPDWQCRAMVNESVDAQGAIVLGVERTLSTVPFRILGPAAPILSGYATPAIVPQETLWTTVLDLRNAAYSAAGALLGSGARLSARESVVYYRVPRDGDIDAATQGGALVVEFNRAWSDEPRAIWVANTEEPGLPIESQLASSPSWVLCAAPGTPCDALALAAAGVSTDAVRWVAFVVGEAMVTDAEPRGVRPRTGIERVEDPYLQFVELRDVGSDPGVLVRPTVLLASLDAAQLQGPYDAYDALIRGDCVENGCTDDDMCTTDTCDPITGLCTSAPVECDDDSGLYSPVINAAGEVVGAIRCALVNGAIACDVGPDTDGDGRPNLIIDGNAGGACD